MYIDFIDTLRNIQNGIYPQVKEWRDETEVLRGETLVLRNETEALKDVTVDLSGHALASEKNAKSWAVEPEWYTVHNFTWDEEANELNNSPLAPAQYSAMHWALQSKSLAEIEKWKAEAAQMTACSFSNEPVNMPVKVYVSNGDGTFTSNELDYVFSALHYRQDTEQLTGHKRWIESQDASEGQSIFGFQKNINHADVYVNGVRQVEGSCYTRILKDLHFSSALREGDTVTVSGMEAITGDEFQTILEQNQEIYKDTQKLMWEAEASEMTAQSFASEPVDVFVKVFTSNDDGTFQSTTTTLYSALHWSVKMNLTLSYMVIVDTYADLELLNVNDAKIVYVRGGYAINDGRHGLFHYDSTQSSINNGGTIIDGWVREFDGAMNIMWFNVSGNGVIDDTSAILAALPYSDHILFPENTYRISDEILIGNKKIISQNALFETAASTGTAFVFRGMREHYGVFGTMKVKWLDNDMDIEKVSFRIDDSDKAYYKLSSEGATTGIYAYPENGDVIKSIIRVDEMIDNTIGVFANKKVNNFKVKECLFEYGDFTQTKQIYPTYFNANHAGHIYVENQSCEKLIFNSPSLYVENNDNDEFKLFEFSGTSCIIRPRDFSIENASNIYGEISGDYNIADFTQVPDLLIYTREDVANGYVSNIDTMSTDTIKVIGHSNVQKVDNLTYEYSSNGKKSLMTLENLLGISTYYPVQNQTHDVEHIEVEGGDVDTITSAYRTQRYNESTLNKSVIANDLLTFDDTVDFNLQDRFQMKINDAVDMNHITKLKMEITDTIDNLLALKDSVTITESVYTGRFVKNDISFTDTVDNSHLSQLEMKINDGTYSVTIDKTRMAITNGLVDYYVDRDNAKFTDGSQTNERTAVYSEIISGTDSNKAIATDIDIISGLYRTNLSNTRLNITDGVDTLNGDRYSVDISDGINTNHTTKTSAKIFDGLDSNESTKLVDTITDGTNTNHQTKTVSEIFDATDKNENDKLHQKIFDATDSNEDTKTSSKISDATDSNESTKTDITVTDSTDTLHASKMVVEVSDATDKNESTKLHDKIFDATDSHTETKFGATITDGTDTSTMSKTEINISDASQSLSATKETITMTDGADVSTQDATDNVVTDGTDTGHLSKIEMKINDAVSALTATKNQLSIVDAGKSITLNTESMVFVEGDKQNTMSAEESRVEDTSTGNSNVNTDSSNIITAGTDEATLSATGLTAEDGTDTGSYGADLFGITDGIKSHVGSKDGSVIQDGANTVTTSATVVQVQNATDTTDVSADTISISGGTGTNILKQDSVELTAGAQTNKVRANDSVLTSGGNTNTDTALDSVLSDGINTVTTTSQSVVASDGVTGSSTIDSAKVEVKDGTTVSQVKKEGLVATDGINTVDMKTDGASEIIRSEVGVEALKVQNIAVGGVAQSLDVAATDDIALQIKDNGTVATEISAGQNWTVAGKKIVWAIGAAPSSGVWSIGDIAYDSAPVAGGKIGWVFVSKSSETGDIAVGSPTISNVTNATAFTIGDNISGPGIPVDSFVTAVDTVGNTLTLNTNATATTVGITLTTTGWKPFGAIDA